MKATEEKSRIRIRNPVVRIRWSWSVSNSHGSGTPLPIRHVKLTSIIMGILLLVGELVHGGKEGNGVPGCKQRQQVGRQEGRHGLQPSYLKIYV